MDDVCAV